MQDESSCYYIGGIIGSSIDLELTNCYTTGNIRGTGNFSNIGGILGQLPSAYTTTTSTITDCYTTGNIEVTISSGNSVGRINRRNWFY